MTDESTETSQQSLLQQSMYTFASVAWPASKRAMEPFDRLLRRWHSWVSRKLNAVLEDDESLYLEYDAHRNTYVIAVPEFGHPSDDYERGHTAGKLAVLIGMVPVVAAFVAADVFGGVATLLPEHRLVALGLIVVAVSLSVFMVTAVLQLVTISVEMQYFDERQWSDSDV